MNVNKTDLEFKGGWGVNRGMKGVLVIAVALLCMHSTVQAEPIAGTIKTEPKTGMEFVWVPSGCFKMGSDSGAADEKPVHEVCFNQGFWMGKYEVTQAQYQRVMEENPSEFKSDPNKPVEKVNWSDARFMSAEMSYVAEGSYRLPSEAEWEYACKAGRESIYCGAGDLASRLGWYDGNSGKTTHEIGGKKPNEWGLHDMSGNVTEWTEDCSNDNYEGAPTDGSAWTSGDCTKRVLRGGSWYYFPAGMRASDRYRSPARARDDSFGLRLVYMEKEIEDPMDNFDREAALEGVEGPATMEGSQPAFPLERAETSTSVEGDRSATSVW